MKPIIASVVLAVLVAGGIWFALAGRPTTPSADNPIRLGAVLSLTGIAASYGEPARNAMQLAVEEINARGGVDGRMVTLTVEDDQTKPDKAIAAFRKLTSVDKVAAVAGGNFDFATAPLLPVAEAEGIAFLSPANMRIPGGIEPSGQSFVLMPEFDTVIRELTSYIEAHETNKLAVVHFKSAFGTQIATTLSAVMQELGRGPIVDEAYTSIGNNDFRTTVIKLKQQGVDTVFLDMVDVDPVNFLTAARDLDYHPTVISYYGIVDSFAAPGADRSLLEGVVVLDWESSSPRFETLYEKRYGVKPTHTAEKSYQSIYALAQAVAATDKPSEVAAYLESHAIETPSGKIRFNSKHAVDTTPVSIKIVRNGELVAL